MNGFVNTLLSAMLSWIRALVSHLWSLLNSEDGGQRRFILITNNESDICRRVTVPRVRAAMERYGIDAALLEIQLS